MSLRVIPVVKSCPPPEIWHHQPSAERSQSISKAFAGNLSHLGFQLRLSLSLCAFNQTEQSFLSLTLRYLHLGLLTNADLSQNHKTV